MNTQEEIAATLAHEFKNPLSLITLHIDLLEQVDKTHGKYYDKMRSELKKLESMVVDFLKMTLPQAEITEQVNINDLLKETVSKYCYPNIQFIFKEETELVLEVIPKKIRIVFDNLIKNSIEAIGDTNGNIYITVKENEIIFKDNGGGFSETPEDFKTTKEKGSGVGLYLCRKIAEEYGGKFNIESDSIGCTAKITF
ncbi:MAG: HAMP domain-containing histidine kinase [Defluviitaleaceae bacterium]|nr:HAMP domain-containing histidine kinase [Defluviitaleaceae bacterium]